MRAVIGRAANPARRRVHPGSRAITRALVGLVIAVALTSTATAQTVQGVVAQGCGVTAANGEFAQPLTAAVPARQAVIVTVSTRDRTPVDVVVADAGGTSYQPIGSGRSRGEAPAASLLAGRTTTPLASGGIMRIGSRAPRAGVPICLLALAVNDVAVDAATQRGRAVIRDAGGAPIAIAERGASGVPSLLVAGIAFDADCQTLVPQAGSTATPVTCSAGAEVCTAALHRVDADGTADRVGGGCMGTPAFRLVLAGLPRDSLFRDSLE